MSSPRQDSFFPNRAVTSGRRIPGSSAAHRSADLNPTSAGTGGVIGWIRYYGNDSDYASKAVITVSGNRNSGNVTGGGSAGGIVGHIYNAAEVTGNVNTAGLIRSSGFAAGVAGSLQFSLLLCRAPRRAAAAYSPTWWGSTIGAAGLNFSVRYG